MLTDHCEACPWRGCSTCQFQGGVDPNAPVAQPDSGATRRANQGALWDNYGTTESVPAPALTDRGLGRTAEESDAMIVAKSDDYATRMARIDGCPECITNTEPPLNVRGTTGQPGFTAEYRCTDCGHRWTTAWLDVEFNWAGA